MKVAKVLIAISAGFFLLACSPALPKKGAVIPRTGGEYETVVKDRSREAALERALYTAKSECAEMGQRFEVSDNSENYDGVISEGAAKTVDMGRRIAAAAGVWGIPSVKGDYTVRLKFRCVGND